MIISASRRTDIPAFYCTWFLNRLREGYCIVRNPSNPGQVSRVSLAPKDVDAIVFWSKNPAPLIPHLAELDRRGYRYYFLYTLNPYGSELETNVPALGARLDTFRCLSARLGPERVIWRYDPVILSNHTGGRFHEEMFVRLAEKLAGSTRRVIVSLVDYYRKTGLKLEELERAGWTFRKVGAEDPEVRGLLAEFRRVADAHDIEIRSCAEDAALPDIGVLPGRCIDTELIHSLWGIPKAGRDPNQRRACGCALSKDVGAYNTCMHGCRYCYATWNTPLARSVWEQHDPGSPVLCSGGRESGF